MKDSRNAPMLRQNVLSALAISVVCLCIAKFLSFASTNTRYYAPKHVVKSPRVFDDAKILLAKNSDQEFPTQQRIYQYKKNGVKAIIIDFPGVSNVTNEWKVQFSSFVNSAKTSSFQYAFNIFNSSKRGSKELENDLDYILGHFIESNYFKYEEKPFVVFGLDSSTGSVRSAMKSFARDPNSKVFPCAIIDDRDLIKKSYEDGLECFMSSPNPDSYSWSANPTSWDSMKNLCQTRASLFIPVVQNVFKAADNRMYDMPDDHPEDFSDESDPEQRRIKREERRKEKLQKIRAEKSDFKYAWEYAVKASNFIVVQPKNNSNWEQSEENIFLADLENLTAEWH